MKEFDESVDYKSAHLAWLAVNKSFKPKGWMPCVHFSSYYDQMDKMYFSSDAVIKQQKTAFICFRDDYNWQNKKSDIIKDAQEMFGTPEHDTNEWFVTIGFNHQAFTPVKAHNYVMKLFQKEFVTDAYGAFEIHTENGEHPHFMFYLKTDCKSKGRVVDRIFQSAGSKNLILAKNFINVQPFQQRHIEYIKGNKSEDKMGFVTADRFWRNANNLPEIIKK